MKVFNKVCKDCGQQFIGKGPAAMYCEEHRQAAADRQREKNRIRVAETRARTGAIKKPGSGKGGNPYRGASHPSYKHGMYIFERLRKEVRHEMKNCERCGKDLINVGPSQWCVHHRDHNHWNHTRTNLELLCRRCHAIEHECHLAFTKGATTIPRGSTLK